MASGNTQKRKHSDDEDVGNEDELNYSDEEGGVRVDDIYIPPAPPAVCSLTSSGPRLIITDIVNEWFKSYSREQRVGPFHKCFNAIVGPNGSGKSNVIDSMLFVFGYRANKIRSKKLSTLLHNSEQHKNVQACTVSVHFQSILDKADNEYEIVPGSEFVVSRVAHKDNSSYYRLNGRKVQFKEVAVLLKKHGIDLDHNRFLILQGEVEQISMMKPKASNEHETGMLEYLEDIIGTSRYKDPLVKLNDRVEILTEQKTDKLNRLNLAQHELSELRGPMEEAVGFLKLENEITNHKNILYQNHIVVIEEQVKDKDASKQKVENDQKEIAAEIERLTLDRVEKENVLKQQTKKYDSLTKKRDLLKEAFDKANLRDIQLQAEMQQQNTTRKKTKELLAEEKKKLPTYEKIPEEAAKSIEEYCGKEEEMSKKKEILEEDKVNALSTIKNDTKELQEKRERIQTELIELNKIANAAESVYTLSETELKIYVSSEENEQKKYENLMESYETTKKTIEERKQQIVTLKKKIPLTQKSLKEARDEFAISKLEEEKIVAEIRKKRAIVEESKASMQATRSRGRVLDSLMQQKREGKCPGLFGRLGDLGAINEKYDVAISTACGPLDNIVVDTVDTAQWCIEFLKSYDIGRATFIALEKQEHLSRYANSTIQTPENVPRLFDLVRIEDDRVRTAFYFALRDTLVANNLDQASRIAYGAKRYRVVTLRGELIETTGTMSGGGKSVSKGRMGQSLAVTSTSQLDVQKMEEELGHMFEQGREFRRKQDNLEGQINTLLPELRNMEMNLEKFVIELRSLSEQEPALSKQLMMQADKAKATKADPAQVKKMTALVNKEKKAYEEAAANAALLQVQVDAIATEIKDMVTSRTKVINKNLNDVNKTIDKCRAEISRLKVSIKTAERNFKKSSEKIVIMEKDITQLENNLRAMKIEREEIENDAQELLKCIEEMSSQLNDEENEYSAFKVEVSTLMKQENKLKGDKIEIDQKLKTIKKSIGDLQGNIHNWKTKLKKLKLQQIPDKPEEELKTYTAEELHEMNIQAIERKLQANEESLKSSTPNLNAIEEYMNKQTVYVERAKELEQISEKRNKMREMFDSLRNRRKQEFLIGYNTIKLKLKEMYQMITLGGDADFEMVDSYDPFTEGIQFNVRPPKKSWKNICNLSGGEKTLSSLALVFALHYYKPSPLYVMDEIDAALDFKNVSIVGHYIKERTKNAQFIIISLRSNMFELCDHLVGIYKTFNCTHSVTIDPRLYGDVAKINTNDDNNELENDGLPANVHNGNSLRPQENTNMLDEDELSIVQHSVTSSDNLVIADSFAGMAPSMDVDSC